MREPLAPAGRGRRNKAPQITADQLGELESANNSPTLEANEIASGKSPEALAKEAAVNEHGRSENFKQHFELIAIVALYLGSLAVAAATLIYLVHILTPYRWLDDSQLSKLTGILTGGLLTGVLTGHVKRRLQS